MGLRTVDEVMAQSPRDLRLMRQAQRLKDEDRSYWLHLLAYEEVRAGLTDGKGRSLYPCFEDFYNGVPKESTQSGIERLKKRFRKGGD